MRVLAALLLLPLMAHAETHAVTVRNGTAATVRAIMMAPAGSAGPGANRMRSQLPPGAQARITYSTGCRADLRLMFQDGRTEEHAGLDVCSDPTVVAGQVGVAGPSTPVMAIPRASGGRARASSQAVAPTTQRAPPPVVPAWHGRSIIKRFGGLD